MLQLVLLVTLNDALVCSVAAFQSRLTVAGLTSSVASPAAWVMVQVAVWPAASVTMSCAVFSATCAFLGMLANWMENGNSALAHGSPVMFAPLFVSMLFAL